MKRLLSALVLVAFAATTLVAQSPRDSTSRTSFVVQVRHGAGVSFAPATKMAPADSGRSHAMRNGAIVGAVLGLTAGVVGSTYLNFGCLTLVESPQVRGCSVSHSEHVAAISLGVTGALAGALVGAVTGKVVSLAQR